LAGGVAFGLLMQALGMLPMVAALVGSDSVAVGWLVHLFNSALFGAVFALVLGRWATTLVRAIGLGLLYGLFWWVLGALIIMPTWLGMNDMVLQVNEMAWWSLVGHAMYGVLLGAVYAMVRTRDASRR